VGDDVISRLYFVKEKFGGKFIIPEQFEVRKSLLSFGAESFIFQFAIQKI